MSPAPRNWPFFYGWMILFAGSVGVIVSGPGQTGGVAPFTESLLTALGLTRVELSTAYMIGTICSSLILTRAGRLYDRLGARVMAPASGILLGLSLLALSRCDRVLASITTAFPVLERSVTAVAVATGCFFLLRFSGQGVMTMVSNNMMMKWFDRHRGLVTGITGMVISPAFAVMPYVLSLLVEGVGWRDAWLRLAIGVGIGFTLFAWLVYRDNPEECGLTPDGPWGARDLGSKRAAHHRHVQFTLEQARRMPVFWTFALGLSLFACIMTGFIFHVASIFGAAGLPEARGFAIFLPASIVSVALRPLIGWLADRIALKVLLMGLLIGLMACSAGIAFLGPRWSLVLLVGGTGVAGACVGTLLAATWPNFFGRSNLGAISGFVNALLVFASAIGPWAFGQCLALTGSYAPIAGLSFGLAFVLLMLAPRADDPQIAASQ